MKFVGIAIKLLALRLHGPFDAKACRTWIPWLTAKEQGKIRLCRKSLENVLSK